MKKMNKKIVFNLVLLFMLIPSFPINYESGNEILTQKNSDSPNTNQIIQKIEDYHDLVIEGYGKSIIAIDGNANFTSTASVYVAPRTFLFISIEDITDDVTQCHLIIINVYP